MSTNLNRRAFFAAIAGVVAAPAAVAAVPSKAWPPQFLTGGLLSEIIHAAYQRMGAIAPGETLSRTDLSVGFPHLLSLVHEQPGMTPSIYSVLLASRLSPIYCPPHIQHHLALMRDGEMAIVGLKEELNAANRRYPGLGQPGRRRRPLADPDVRLNG